MTFCELWCDLQIRSKALVQYTTPFTSVNLPTMAQAFNTDVRYALDPLQLQIAHKAHKLMLYLLDGWKIPCAKMSRHPGLAHGLCAHAATYYVWKIAVMQSVGLVWQLALPSVQIATATAVLHNKHDNYVCVLLHALLLLTAWQSYLTVSAFRLA